MSKIEELIKEKCPNGVEYKKLKDICIVLKKGTLKTTELIDSGYPVINSGRNLYGYYNEYNNDGNALTVAARGEYAGYINYFSNNFWAGGLCYPYKSAIENKIMTKFIYYYLKNIEKKIRSEVVADGSIPALNKSDLEKIKVPVPPIEVQEEIVRILDKFSELEAELEAELEELKKQYVFWRGNLLNMKGNNYYLDELFDTKNGFTPSKNNSIFWNEGTVPWFRMEDIRANGRILKNAIQSVTLEATKGNIFKKNSIIVATSATIGEHALIETDFLCNQRFTCMTLKEENKNNINMKYIYYYCFLLDDYCKQNVQQGNFNSVNINIFKKFVFKIPPLEEQERIVNILDKFDTLINDFSVGIPAEIKLRRKQYEYYRNKLLSFKELKVNE